MVALSTRLGSAANSGATRTVLEHGQLGRDLDRYHRLAVMPSMVSTPSNGGHGHFLATVGSPLPDNRLEQTAPPEVDPLVMLGAS